MVNDCFSESNTWEPIDKLNCPDLIKNFEEKIQNQGKDFCPWFWYKFYKIKFRPR